ncbi:MAG: hypothetical protein JWQ87_1994 [Candidatus Sulfotelmatobacter sp.]|nr:hypothetical protein [Candidatus Sulfotelmatobacter sp.]
MPQLLEATTFNGAGARRQAYFIRWSALVDTDGGEIPASGITTVNNPPMPPVQPGYNRAEQAGRRVTQFVRFGALAEAGEDWPTHLTQPNNPPAPPVKAAWGHSEQAGRHIAQFIRFGALAEDGVPTPFLITPVIPVEQFSWRDFEEWAQRNTDTRFNSVDSTLDDFTNFPLLPTPGMEWDAHEWQQNRDFSFRFANSDEDSPTQLPFIPPPAPNMGWDEWDWSKNYDRFAVWAQFEHEDWPSTLANSVDSITGDFFDEFEEQYHSRATYQGYSWPTLEEDWVSTGLAASAPVPMLGWDDLEWYRRYDQTYAPQTTEEDIAFPIIIPVPFGGDWDALEYGKDYTLQYAPQMDDLSDLVGIVPWPAWWDDWDWSRDFTPYVVKPVDDLETWHNMVPPIPAAYDDWDWSKDFSSPIPLTFLYAEEEPFSNFTIIPVPTGSGGWVILVRQHHPSK